MQRQYTKEFKKDIVGYVLADWGRPMREVAEGFGVILSALERWVSESKAKSRGSVVKDMPHPKKAIYVAIYSHYGRAGRCPEVGGVGSSS